jgi:hypothetical protein
MISGTEKQKEMAAIAIHALLRPSIGRHQRSIAHHRPSSAIIGGLSATIGHHRHDWRSIGHHRPSSAIIGGPSPTIGHHRPLLDFAAVHAVDHARHTRAVATNLR